MKTNLWVQICKIFFFGPSELKFWEHARLHTKSNLALMSSLITASATNCGSWYTTLRSDLQIDHKLLWYHTFSAFNDGPYILRRTYCCVVSSVSIHHSAVIASAISFFINQRSLVGSFGNEFWVFVRFSSRTPYAEWLFTAAYEGRSISGSPRTN